MASKLESLHQKTDSDIDSLLIVAILKEIKENLKTKDDKISNKVCFIYRKK